MSIGRPSEGEARTAEAPNPLEVVLRHDLRVLDPRARVPRGVARDEPLQDVQHDVVCPVANAVDVLRTG
jgi:hypothetical protein